MTDVKPATDYMVGSIQKAHRHCSTTECGDVLVLLARVDADREEIASVRKAAASKDRLIEQQAAEIAALKAEVERMKREVRLSYRAGRTEAMEEMDEQDEAMRRVGRAR